MKTRRERATIVDPGFKREREKRRTVEIKKKKKEDGQAIIRPDI